MTGKELTVVYLFLGVIFILVSALLIAVGSLHDKVDHLLKDKK